MLLRLASLLARLISRLYERRTFGPEVAVGLTLFAGRFSPGHHTGVLKVCSKRAWTKRRGPFSPRNPGEKWTLIQRWRWDLKPRLDNPLTCAYANWAWFFGDFDLTWDHKDHAPDHGTLCSKCAHGSEPLLRAHMRASHRDRGASLAGHQLNRCRLGALPMVCGHRMATTLPQSHAARRSEAVYARSVPRGGEPPGLIAAKSASPLFGTRSRCRRNSSSS